MPTIVLANHYDGKTLDIIKRVVPEGFELVVRNSADYDELFCQSDIITPHCPLTEEMREIINSEAVKYMKDGVVIVNTGRGGLINEDVLYEGLFYSVMTEPAG